MFSIDVTTEASSRVSHRTSAHPSDKDTRDANIRGTTPRSGRVCSFVVLERQTPHNRGQLSVSVKENFWRHQLVAVRAWKSPRACQIVTCHSLYVKLVSDNRFPPLRRTPFSLYLHFRDSHRTQTFHTYVGSVGGDLPSTSYGRSESPCCSDVLSRVTAVVPFLWRR